MLTCKSEAFFSPMNKNLFFVALSALTGCAAVNRNGGNGEKKHFKQLSLYEKVLAYFQILLSLCDTQAFY
jgi:hypothetical protein